MKVGGLVQVEQKTDFLVIMLFSQRISILLLVVIGEMGLLIAT
jgi:hypothetical protein